MDRVGAGFIAILSSLFFAMFDITASILVLIGFLIFRWAVIAAPVLGTIGLLRPASAGLRRLANAVVAAVFNIVIFGTGAAIYLYAVDLIMNTSTLPGWLQVVLCGSCGVVGWLLLRPYRRITQTGRQGLRAPRSRRLAAGIGGSSATLRAAARLDVAERGATDEPTAGPRPHRRRAGAAPESRHEDPVEPPRRPAGARTAAAVAAVAAGQPELAVAAAQPATSRTPPRRPATGPSRTCRTAPANYASTGPARAPAQPAAAPGRRPESSPVGG